MPDIESLISLYTSEKLCGTICTCRVRLVWMRVENCKYAIRQT